MAPLPGRRSRTLESDDDAYSKPGTPCSTAPNDSKRQRRIAHENDSSSDESSIRAMSPASMMRKAQTTAVMKNNSGTQSGHQPGAIVRVKLTNFVTYTSAEFFPGPNLNMVIGPNGTGKSTLVCAICLGLGWPPSYLGRAKDTGEFVKHGCREATIEIELQGNASTRKNMVVTRLIKREGNKSEFFLNGTRSTSKAIQTLANTFNIQIDNLCQFLPQDKVVEFAQMSPIELLASTQRAAASPEMIKCHEDLKKLQSSQSQLMGESRGDQEQLENLVNRQDMQRTEVERMRERALVKKRLEWLEKCRPIAQYSEAKSKYQEAKQNSRLIAQELKKLEAASAPMLQNLNSKQEYARKVGVLKAKHEKELTTSGKGCDMKAKAIQEIQDKLCDLDNQIENERKTIPANRGEIKRHQQKIVELKQKKEQRPEQFDSRAVSDAIQELKGQRRALEEQVDDLESRKRELKEQGQNRNRQLSELTTQVEGLETQSGQQEGKLQRLSRETFRAWKWLQDNRAEFTQHVYGPPIVECALKDPRMADAIESLLQDSDFKIITAQNRADFLKLQQKLMNDQGLHDISLRECANTDLEHFRPPLGPQDMRKFGLSSWVLDHIEGPPTVLAMLCHEKGLHRCGLSPQELSQQQHDDLAKTAVQSYVGGRKCYQFVRRAEYGSAGTSARVRDVRPAQRWTDQPIDLGRKAALQRSIGEIRGENTIIKAEFDEVKRKITETNEQIKRITAQEDTLAEERDAKQHALMQWKALDSKIQEREEKVTNLERQINEFKERVADLREQKDATYIEKAEAVLKYISATRDMKLKTASLLESEIMLLEASSDLQILNAQNQHIVNTITQKKAEVEFAERTFKEEHERAKAVLVNVRKLMAEGDQLAEEGEPGFGDTLQLVADELKTEENLNAEIDAEKAKLELTEGGSAGIIKEFESRAKVIEELRLKIQETDKLREDFKHGIKEIRDRWEPQLEQLVAQINDAFSDSFARIGCAGQVAIHKASSSIPADCTEENGGTENGLDFANWAIHISVKFREQEPLSLLDSHRQSGGERAVSTIFYLMALQSLSRAPFRVVDEINQGMDPRNERMVHGRMVDIAAAAGGGQYFLITPKLLSGLKYRKGMTVLCIVSGENVQVREQRPDGEWVDAPKIDFRAFVQKARELGLGRKIRF